jgi:hypothetical protein
MARLLQKTAASRRRISMDPFDRCQTTHQDLSPQDLEFRSFAHQRPDLMDRTRQPVFDHGRDLLTFRLQPWPTFVGAEKLAELKRLSLGMSNLLKSVPQRIFASPAERASFYNLPSPEIADIIFSDPNCIAEVIARGDFIDTPQGLKCIEFNFTPNLGGWETPILADMHLSIPGFSEFVNRNAITVKYTNTIRILFQHLVEDALAKGLGADGRLTLGFLLSADDARQPHLGKPLQFFNQELKKMLADLGTCVTAEMIFCPYAELVISRGQVFCRGRRVHSLVDCSDDPLDSRVYRCFKARTVLFYNGPVSGPLSDKRNLALASELESSGLFSDEERQLIRSCLPWSRKVRSEQVEFRGERASLPEVLSRYREDMVLKEGTAAGGKGVLMGISTSAAEWEEAVRKALASGGWMVQERLESRPYLYQSGDSGCAIHDVIWGPFIFGQRYGGVILRMQPACGRPVNLSLTATEGIVLEV